MDPMGYIYIYILLYSFWGLLTKRQPIQAVHTTVHCSPGLGDLYSMMELPGLQGSRVCQHGKVQAENMDQDYQTLGFWGHHPSFHGENDDEAMILRGNHPIFWQRQHIYTTVVQTETTLLSAFKVNASDPQRRSSKCHTNAVWFSPVQKPEGMALFRHVHWSSGGARRNMRRGHCWEIWRDVICHLLCLTKLFLRVFKSCFASC